MFLQQNIHKQTWNSPRKKKLTIRLIVYYQRRYTQTAIFQGPEFYSDYPVTAEFRETLQVTKQAAQKYDEEKLKSQEAKCVGS